MTEFCDQNQAGVCERLELFIEVFSNDSYTLAQRARQVGLDHVPQTRPELAVALERFYSKALDSASSKDEDGIRDSTSPSRCSAKRSSSRPVRGSRAAPPVVYGPEHAAVLSRLDGLDEALGGASYGAGAGQAETPDLGPLVDELITARRQTLPDESPLAVLTGRTLLALANQLAPGAAEETRRQMAEEALGILRPRRREIPLVVADALAQLCERALESSRAPSNWRAKPGISCVRPIPEAIGSWPTAKSG